MKRRILARFVVLAAVRFNQLHGIYLTTSTSK